MKLHELLNERVFHGSRNNHQSFDVSHIGANSHTFGDYSSVRYGTFFTTNPKFAGLYGDVYEYDLTVKNPINLDSNNGKDIIYNFLETLHNNRQLYIGVQNILHTGRNIWTLFEDDIGKHFVKYLKTLNYDSATFIEYNTDDTGKEHKSKTYVVFNPSNIIKNDQYELNLYESEKKLPEYIDYNGQQRATRNSLGDYIGNNIEAIQNFYNWFGNSKIVDEQNRPLVVYHGTNTKIRTFNPKKTIGGLLWFTNRKDLIERGEVGAAGKGVIIPVYLKIENPVGWDEYDKLYHDAIIALGHDGVILPDDDRITYIIYNANHIKSIKNKGSFNINKKNMYENINTLLRYDNPEGEWLQYKIKYAEEVYNKGIRISGPVTAYTPKPIALPTSFLKTLKGANDENRVQGEYQYDKLYSIMKDKGFDENNPILIGINHRGEVYIIEGNTRVAVASDLNIKTIPCEVKYYAGGELKPSILSPKKLHQLGQK